MATISRGLFHPKSRSESRLVEAHHDAAVDIDHWHTHLTALLHHLLAPREIAGNIVLGVRDALRLHEIFREVAVMTGWG